MDDSLAKLSRILQANNYVIIQFVHKHCKIHFHFERNFHFFSVFRLDHDQDTRETKPHIFGIITSIDLLDYIVKNKAANENQVNTAKQNGYHSAASNGNATVAEQSEALKH